ncbi:hypothetical protein ABIA32_001988 [Streptacidiphilus sp. MAP12-20]
MPEHGQDIQQELCRERARIFCLVVGAIVAITLAFILVLGLLAVTWGTYY